MASRAQQQPQHQHLQQQQPPPPSSTHTHTHTSPPPSSSSSPASPKEGLHLHLHLLPDAALATIVECLKPHDLIKRLQVVNHWALRVFAEEIKEVCVVLIMDRDLMKEDPPPEMPPPALTMSEEMIEATTEQEFKELVRSIKEAGDGLKKWVGKYAGGLCAFLSRFPRLTTLRADESDQYLVPLLREVFTRKAFPSVHNLDDIMYLEKLCTHFSFRLLAQALPNLAAITLDEGFLLGSENREVDAFFQALVNGAFPNLQRLTIGPCAGPEEVDSIISKTIPALRARERLGFLSLTELHLTGYGNAQGVKELLSLPSCSSLRMLNCVPAEASGAEEYLELVASYMRQTKCVYLEELPLRRYEVDGLANPFGAVGDVLMTGMATKVRTIDCQSFEREEWAALIKIIEAGALPSLVEVKLCADHFNWMALRAMYENPHINRLLTHVTVLGMDVKSTVSGQVVAMLFHSMVHNRDFRHLKSLNLVHLKSRHLSLVRRMFKDNGIGGADVIRKVLTGAEWSEEELQEFRAFLPLATIRKPKN